MPRRTISGCSVSAVTRDSCAVRAQVDAGDRCSRRLSGCAGLSLHLLRHTVSPALLQLWLVQFCVHTTCEIYKYIYRYIHISLYI